MVEDLRLLGGNLWYIQMFSDTLYRYMWNRDVSAFDFVS